MSFPSAENLRLEIEEPASGLKNLIENPSGDLGAWGWVTPVNNSQLYRWYLETGGTALEYKSPGGAASYFYSEAYTVTPEQYVSASWLAKWVTGFYRAKIEFLDAAGAVVSATAQTAYLNTPEESFTTGPHAIPATASYARLRFDHYSNNTGGNPDAGATFGFNEATMATAATAAELGSYRENLVKDPLVNSFAWWDGDTHYAHELRTLTNLITNPSFETNLTGWTEGSFDHSNSYGSLSRDTADGYKGGSSAKVNTINADTYKTSYHAIRYTVSVVGGETYSIRFAAKAENAGRASQAVIRWRNSSGSKISDEAGTSYTDISNASWTPIEGDITAPSNATSAIIELRTYVKSGNFYSNGQTVSFDAVSFVQVKAWDAAPAYFDGTSTDTEGWAFAWTGTAHASTSTATPVAGKIPIKASPAGGSYVWVRSTDGDRTPVAGGRKYAVQAKFRAATTPRSCWVGLTWYDANGLELSTSYAPGITDAVDTWTKASGVVTADTKAVSAVVEFYVSAPAAGEEHYVDEIQVEQASAVGSFFTGDTLDAGGWDYAWNGTAHASVSSATGASNLAFIEPVKYRDILGPTHDIKVTREALNVGLLNATVLDANIDPATSDLIRPGRAVRLSALNSENGTFEPLFTGETTNASVDYDPQDTTEKRARITLVAADSIRQLSNVRRNEGVASISDLPYVLEGAGVPWIINDNSDQVPTATVVSTNDNASAVDQIAVTRDSNLGYAWVDRRNIFRAYTAAGMPLPETEEKVLNGGFETDLAGWTTWENSTIARSTAQFRTGVASLAMTSVAAGGMWARYTTSCTPGLSYTVSGWTKAATTAQSVTLQVYFYDDAFNQIGSIAYASATNNTTGWTQITHSVTAPAGATQIRVAPYLTASAAGETHYFDDISLIAPKPPLLDEDDYSDLDVDFNTENCINEVIVKFLRYDIGTEDTTEVAYGPYRDENSIAEWGAYRAEFTIHDTTEVEADIAAYAQSILYTNAVPKVRINSVSVPVRSDADLTLSKAFLDLYDLVRISNTNLGKDEVSRITRIEHTITAENWKVDLGFATDGAVASPTFTPSPGNTGGGGSSSKAACKIVKNAQQLFDNNTGQQVTFQTVRVDTRGDMADLAAGYIRIQEPGDYEIQAGIRFAGNANGFRALRVDKNTAPLAGNSGSASTNSWANFVNISTTAYGLVVGDYIRVHAYQNSGAGLNTSTDFDSTFLSVRKIG